jgi:hypothetical protein
VTVLRLGSFRKTKTTPHAEKELLKNQSEKVKSRHAAFFYIFPFPLLRQFRDFPCAELVSSPLLVAKGDSFRRRQEVLSRHSHVTRYVASPDWWIQKAGSGAPKRCSLEGRGLK